MSVNAAWVLRDQPDNLFFVTGVERVTNTLIKVIRHATPPFNSSFILLEA